MQNASILNVDHVVDHDNPAILHHLHPLRHLKPGKMLLADAVKASFQSALADQGKLPESLLAMEGMSGKKYRYFINNLIASLHHPRYLEVGSWAGSTLCSALYGNSVTAVAVDNWSQFGGPVDRFFKNLSEHCSHETKVSVLNCDFRKAPFGSLGKFNVYLFDGPHAADDQYDGLSLALDCLDHEFVFIVDDWNWEQVRVGTLNAIADLELTVASAIEVRTTTDNSHPVVAGQNSDWHNGYYIAILRK